MERILPTGFLTLLIALCVSSGSHAEIYDSFNGPAATWPGPKGVSPDGKWTYEYGKNAEWAALTQENGSLWFHSVQNPGHAVTSTEIWDMPSQPGESLTFTLATTNFLYNKESTFREHWIEVLGDVTSFGVVAGWGSANWVIKDQWDTDTQVPFPTDSKWHKVTIKFYRTKDNTPMWQVRIDRDGKTVFSADRQLYNQWGTNKAAQLRLRSNFARARYDFIAVDSVRKPEPASPARRLQAALKAPATIFRDQAFAGAFTITVRPGTDCPGALYLKVTGRRSFLTIVDSRFAGKAGSMKEYAFSLPSIDFDGNGGAVEVIFRDKAEKDTALAKQNLTVLPYRLPRPGENVLTNGSFELDSGFCGTMLGYADGTMRNAGWDGARRWVSLALDGWWLDEGTTDAVRSAPEGRTGRQSLQLNAGKGKVSAVSSLGRFLPAGAWTLSAYVKTKAATGRLILDFVTGVRQAKDGKYQVRAAVDLPVDAGDWTRVSVTAKSPDLLQFFIHAEASQGTVLIDDIQLEPGAEPAAFNVRPAEFLRLSFEGRDDTAMPTWVNTDAAKRIVQVHNDSRRPLTGRVNLRFGPWNIPDLCMIADFDGKDLAPGQTRRFEFATVHLRPDAYVASVQLKNGGDVIADGIWDFDPHAFVGWAIDNNLHSRSAARFALVAPIDPRKLFGIGNSTQQKSGAQDPRSWLEQHLHIRQIGLACTRGPSDDNNCYMSAAAGGVPIFAQATFDEAGAGPFSNPCSPGRIDVYSKEGAAHIRKVGEDLGRQWGPNPLIVGAQLANEQFWVNGHAPCPTQAADAHFRAWCRKQHGDLATLNARWGTRYTNWDQVDQVISEAFYRRLVASRKDGGAGLAWGGMIWGNTWPKEAVAEMDRLPGKTMDWFRWRTETGVAAYKAVRDAAHKFDTRTLYSTDLPLATFVKQFFIPFGRAMDAVMINARYTSGYEISFGTPHECLSSLEMGESLAAEQNKPFWGIEIYQKPFWPAESAALQNWGMVAHGMAVTLVFSWHPMSDRGDPSNILAWEERRTKKTDDIFERACWYMIDADGAHLPSYESYVRSLAEIRRYHESFDGPSIKRSPTNIGYYISNDSCELATFETRHAGWGAVSERVSYTLIYLLRLQGVTADYIDDATLPDRPGRFQTIIVPLSPVLSSAAAGKLAGFARAGGTVVLVGVSGRKDPWLRPYAGIGGPAWADLGWRAPGYRESFVPCRFDPAAGLPKEPGKSATETAAKPGEARDERVNENTVFRGTNIGTMAEAEPLKDRTGRLIGFQRPWGKGRLIAYGICPDVWTTDPHATPQLTAWTQQLIQRANLNSTGRWTTTGAETAAGSAPGTGRPAVDLVVRVKSPGEKFIFVLNQGGAGKGRIEVPVTAGRWTAEDVIHPGEPIQGRIIDGVWQTDVAVGPLGYRVLRLFWKNGQGS